MAKFVMMFQPQALVGGGWVMERGSRVACIFNTDNNLKCSESKAWTLSPKCP